MKNDPFAGMNDRLFVTTKQRSSETTAAPVSEATKARATVPPRHRTNPRATPPRTPLARPATIRVVERHSHDIYEDQVRWMNRLKLDTEEQHGVKLTSNGIVQIALDLLREDYRRNGERSRLFRVLVDGEPFPAADAEEAPS